MVRGRGGVMLATRWKDGPRTLCGVHVRHFPNMFLVMGPQVQEKRERKGREGGEKGVRERGEKGVRERGEKGVRERGECSCVRVVSICLPLRIISLLMMYFVSLILPSIQSFPPVCRCCVPVCLGVSPLSRVVFTTGPGDYR